MKENEVKENTENNANSLSEQCSALFVGKGSLKVKFAFFFAGICLLVSCLQLVIWKITKKI